MDFFGNWMIPERKKEFFVWDSKSIQTKNIIEWYLKINKAEWFDLALLHPPYDSIIKFTDQKEDLSNCKTTDKFWKVLENSFSLMKNDTVDFILKWI